MSSTGSHRIAVLVSVGSHPVSDVRRYSRNDAAALALARELQRQSVRAAVDVTLDVIHAGAPDDAGLPDYLALGAAVVTVLPVAAGADVLPSLQAHLQGYDLVLCGSRAEGGEQSGCLPYLLAQYLGRPLLPGVVSAQWSAAGAMDAMDPTGMISARQFLPKGRRRDVAVNGPAILAVHPLAPCSLRYAYARRCAGRIEVRQGQVSARAGDAGWDVGPALARPVRLAALEKRSGHARMLSATVTESRGGRVVTEGDAADKARVVLDYLREHRLIDY